MHNSIKRTLQQGFSYNLSFDSSIFFHKNDLNLRILMILPVVLYIRKHLLSDYNRCYSPKAVHKKRQHRCGWLFRFDITGEREKTKVLLQKQGQGFCLYFRISTSSMPHLQTYKLFGMIKECLEEENREKREVDDLQGSQEQVEADR